MTRENRFITHVIREICQNLYVKRDQDPSFATLIMAWPKYKFIMLKHSFLCIYEIHLNYAIYISKLILEKILTAHISPVHL